MRYMPPCSTGVRLVEVIDEEMKDSEQVAAHLDDVIVFHSDPVSHVQTILSLFQPLPK